MTLIFLLKHWFIMHIVRSGADEEGTLERLKALRRELIDPKIAEHHGRIVKTTGDGVLVEFASVVDAVRCAVDVQQAMPERNTGLGADSRIELRIGINLGDVLVEKSRTPSSSWGRLGCFRRRRRRGRWPRQSGRDRRSGPRRWPCGSRSIKRRLASSRSA
jgi:hypothetical protein